MPQGRKKALGEPVGGVPKLFWKLLESSGLPKPVEEHRFAPGRKWRFDLAWPDHLVALEVQGGAWRRRGYPCPKCRTPVMAPAYGAHSGPGAIRDYEKFSTAASLGWAIIMVPPESLCSGRTLDWVARAIESRRHLTRTES